MPITLPGLRQTHFNDFLLLRPPKAYKGKKISRAWPIRTDGIRLTDKRKN